MATKFSEAFERERARLQLDRHVIADQCGVSTKVVKRWGSGEAVPNVQQFKRLIGIMVRIAANPPDWGWLGTAAVDGRAEEVREANRAALRNLRDEGDEPKRPPIQPFHLGLRRIREDNEITQDELGSLLDLTGRAVAAWENADCVPVEENLVKLLSVLPELQYGFEVGAIARPPSQDIPVPTGGAGLPRVVSIVPAPLAALQLPQDDMTNQDPTMPELPGAAPDAADSASTVAALAEAHARARVRLARAKAAEVAAEESFRLATAQRAAAAQDVEDTLQLLELAVQEEASG